MITLAEFAEWLATQEPWTSWNTAQPLYGPVATFCKETRGWIWAWPTTTGVYHHDYQNPSGFGPAEPVDPGLARLITLIAHYTPALQDEYLMDHALVSYLADKARALVETQT